MDDSDIPFHTKSYVCIEVFEKTKPVLLVSRLDGDWCFLCGDGHPESADAYRVAGIGHILEADPTLKDILDLKPEEEAERTAFGRAWIRTDVATALDRESDQSASV